MRTLLIALLLIAPLAAAAAETVFEHPASAAELTQTLAPLTGTLRDARTLAGGFTQKKTVTGLPQPLLAQGTFRFARDHGIVWTTTVPFASEVVITKSGLTQRDSADAAAAQLTSAKNPGIGAVFDIFSAVFALDFAALEKLFVLHGTHEASAWQLGLTPRAGALGGAIASIVVSGRTQVERVVMTDAHGEVTDIAFADTRASAQPPTADELRPFTAP